MKYRPEIDGLRTIAVLPVLFSHAGFSWAEGGFIGVDIFFVISGFLITQIIVSETESGDFSIGRFYERRARRILPALFFVVAACVPAAWLLLTPDQMREFGHSLIAVPIFASNFLFWMEADYFATDSGLKPLIHTWSLAVEEQFYIFFPLLVVAIFWLGRNLLVPALLLITAVSLVLADWSSLHHPEASFFLLHTRAWELLIGSLAAIAYLRGVRVSPAFANLLSIGGMIMVVGALALFTEETRHPGYLTLFPVMGTALLLLFGTTTTLPGRLLSTFPFVWIGLISYSLYLWHQPLFAFTRMYLIGAEPIDLAIPMAVSFVLAYLSWRFVEAPFRNRTLVALPRIVGTSAVFTLVPIYLGFAVTLADGFPARWGAQQIEIANVIQREFDRRLVGIRHGRCHYNRNVGPVGEFLERWDCLPENDGPRILVVGDSHAADKAWALREAGINAGQLTAAGCRLSPAPNGEISPWCASIFEHVQTLAEEGRIDGLVLATRWSGNGEHNRAVVEEVRKMWANVDVPTAIFLPMPNFGDFADRWREAEEAGVGPEIIDYVELQLRVHSEGVSELTNFGFTTINTRDNFCGRDQTTCVPIVRGQPLLIDYGHLSSYGAKQFAANLAQDDDWLGWLMAME